MMTVKEFIQRIQGEYDLVLMSDTGERANGSLLNISRYPFICKTNSEALGVIPYLDYELVSFFPRQDDIVLLIKEKECNETLA